MNNTIKLLVNLKKDRKRLDVFLSEEIKDYTRSYIKKLIEKKCVKLNNIVVTSSSIKLKTNDKVSLKIVEPKKNELIPKNIKLETIYEDKDILVVNKPKGMVVHPCAGNYENTIVNAHICTYKNELSNINGELRPGIVHRIDKETSGLLVVAKNNFSHSILGKQFSDHSIIRKYRCLIWG